VGKKGKKDYGNSVAVNMRKKKRKEKYKRIKNKKERKRQLDCRKCGKK